MNRRMVLAATLASIVVAGCSTAKQSTPTPPSPATASASASAPATSTSSGEMASAPLGKQACVDITQANVDLATASDAGAARTAGDLFEKYDPPTDVRDAVEHFVSTKGAQFDDPDYDKYNNTIEAWIKEVCPL